MVHLTSYIMLVCCVLAGFGKERMSSGGGGGGGGGGGIVYLCLDLSQLCNGACWMSAMSKHPASHTSSTQHLTTQLASSCIALVL